MCPQTRLHLEWESSNKNIHGDISYHTYIHIHICVHIHVCQQCVHTYVLCNYYCSTSHASCICIIHVCVSQHNYITITVIISHTWWVTVLIVNINVCQFFKIFYDQVAFLLLVSYQVQAPPLIWHDRPLLSKCETDSFLL